MSRPRRNKQQSIVDDIVDLNLLTARHGGFSKSTVAHVKVGHVSQTTPLLGMI